ncbi:MAG: SLC13 family permease [Opitutales bacterium]|nr:SLC13 family permease [Opitutales bacterium]
METQTHSRTNTQNVGLILGFVLCLLALLFFHPDPSRPEVGKMTAIVLLMATWWVTEAVPLAATSLVPMVLFPLVGIASGKQIAGSYMNSIIFLYIGGFLIALAMERWNLHRRIALTIIHAIGKKTDLMILGFMVAAAFLSMWISNTATAVMMLPIGLAIISQMETEFGKERAHKLSLALLLGIAFSCSIGGVATPVGTPTNLAFLKIFEDTFPSAPAISFGQWFLMGLPLSIVVLICTWFLLTKLLCRVDQSMVIDREIIRNEIRKLGKLKYEEIVVLAVWVLTACLWIFRGDLTIGIFTIPGWKNLWSGFAMVDDSTVAVLMALLIFVIPSGKNSPGKAIIEVDVFRNLPWSAILLFGGGFALANGFTSSGLTEYLALQFGKMGDMPIILVVILACVGVTLVTELVSNIATVQMFVPVLASWAVAQEVNPLLLMVPATIVSSMAFLMPVATPPNAVIFGSERIRIIEMVRLGLWIKVAAVIITILVVLLLMPVFFNIQPGLPEWAITQ